MQFSGGIECMRFRLLLPMITVSVCLSRGSTRHHRAKTAKQIKILFRVNIFRGPSWNIVLDGSFDPPQRRGRELGKILAIMDPINISRTAKGRDSSACSVCGAFDAAFAKLL